MGAFCYHSEKFQSTMNFQICNAKCLDQNYQDVAGIVSNNNPTKSVKSTVKLRSNLISLNDVMM